MGVSEIGFPQNVVYKQRIQTSDTLPVTIGASKYCEFLFDIDAGDRMTPLGIVGWGCNDKTQVFLLDFYLDNDLQTAKLILKNPYATTIAITSLYIDVIYSKQALDMSEVDVVDNLTTDSAVAALSARQGKVLDDKITSLENDSDSGYCKFPDGTLMCWKTEGRNNTGSSISYTFPINFISLPTVVITTGAGGERVPIYAEDVTTSGFNVYRTGNGTASIWIRWLAIGRWK